MAKIWRKSNKENEESGGGDWRKRNDAACENVAKAAAHLQKAKHEENNALRNNQHRHEKRSYGVSAYHVIAAA